MKRFLFVIVLLVSVVSAAFASIPGGVYADNRGRNKVAVAVDGKEVYLLDSSGNVQITYDVVEERYDSENQVYRVNLRARGLGTVIPAYYWTENGEVYFNISAYNLHRV